MVRRILALGILAFAIGCGANEPIAAPEPQGPEAPAVPPAELRTMLEGLQSDHPRMQYVALENLSRFPSVVQTYREHVERLRTEGKDERVREKAAELLASREERE